MRLLSSVSIRHKLLLVSLATTATALSLASAAFILLGVSLARKSVIMRAEAILAKFGTQAVPVIQSQNPAGIDQLFEQLGQNPQIVAFCLYTLDGRPLKFYLEPSSRSSPEPPPAEDFDWRFREGHLEMFRLVPLSGVAVGRVYLRYDPKEYTAELRAYGTVAIGVILVPFGLAWLLSSRLREVLSRPILQLTHTAERVWMEKDYSIRAAKESDDELGKLIDGFNRMLDRIQERDRHLHQAREQLESRVKERTRELQEQVNRSSLLNQITRGMAQRQDLDSILQVTLGQLESRMAIDFGCVYLFDPPSGRLQIAASRGQPLSSPQSPLTSETLELHADQVGFSDSDHDRTHYASDLAGNPQPPFRVLAGTPLRSAVAVPLRVEQQRFGLLVAARRCSDGFTRDDQEFLRTLGEQVALAGHQAQLHADLKRAYDELRQTQEAVTQQERLRALGQMASGIAHDVNNALSPVSGFAELLLLTEKNVSPASRRYLEHIKTAGDDVAHIVARLREFYRPRQGDHAFAPIRVNRLIRQVTELTRPRWRDISQQRGLTVDIQLDLDDRDPQITGAESEIREALTNLLFNALDAMPEGGTITLRSRFGTWCPRPDDHAASATVILEVTDTGTGMDSLTRQRCLEPFFSTKGQRGTGLGLAMVYGVIQRHEGSIEIDSEPGLGSTMRLILPAYDHLPAPAAGSSLSVDPLPSLRILFVDDEPLVRELVQQILQTEGHSVTLADGGQAGLDAFFAAAWRDQPFDAVITDLGMPSVDGRQLTHVLKRESPLTPVIMMTGWGSLVRHEDELRVPVDALLSKPPSIRALQDALRRVIRPAPSSPT